MKRILTTVALLTCLSLASAQRPESFVGVGATNLSLTNLFPVLSVQLGGPVAPNVEVRGVLETILIGNLLGADVNFVPKLSDELSLAFGGGPHFTLVAAAGGGGAGFGAHAQGGVVYRPNGGGVGIYGELRPTILYLASPTLDLQLRLGANFYF